MRWRLGTRGPADYAPPRANQACPKGLRLLWRMRRHRNAISSASSVHDAAREVPHREVGMNSKSMAGWIAFAGMLLLIVGSIDFFQGLIALFEDEYFVVTASGFLAFDLTAWGWIMVIWGVLLALAGVGLLGGQGWARWFAIVVVSLNFIAQLGFLGNSQYPLWSLTVMALNVIVLYALTARWSESAVDLNALR